MQVQIDVDAKLTGITIIPTDPPRLMLTGVWRVAGDDGRPVRQWSEDVTDQLTPTQQQFLVGLVMRANTWLANKT